MNKRSNINLLFDNYSYQKPTKKTKNNSDDFFFTFFGKNLDDFTIYQNLKNASNKSTPMSIPNLPCDIICDLEETTED
ncbi:8402_t:CDS:1, partial [Scutellospora calospora]